MSKASKIGLKLAAAAGTAPNAAQTELQSLPSVNMRETGWQQGISTPQHIPRGSYVAFVLLTRQ